LFLRKNQQIQLEEYKLNRPKKASGFGKMSIEKLRSRINKIDDELLSLLNERAKVVIEIGRLKKEKDAQVYSPEREREIFDRILKANKGPLSSRTLMAVWRELMSGSLELERSLRIGYLGPEGSFSHTAALLKFGQSVSYEPHSDIVGVFEEVGRGQCDLGIVPVENTTGGGVDETLDSFFETDVKVCAEVLMVIHHNLLSNCPLKKIKKVYSRPEIFTQCRRWLSTTLRDAETVAVASSAKAADIASAEEGSAAIGSAMAGQLYGLKVLRENIEDIADNITRFFVIGKEDAKATGDDKTAVLFSTAHKSGALADVLDIMKKHKINLTCIESRPSKKGQFEYYFFVDFPGHRTDKNVKAALEEAAGHCLKLVILGSFPRATQVL
jgi:chorismate mutase/prephenate dehydratase